MTGEQRRMALLTGSAGWMSAVSEALEGVGFEVARLKRPGEGGGGLEPHSFDCYVQLPFLVRAGQGTPIEQLRDFLTGGLLARFEAAAAVLPSLRPGATVVLVAGHQTPKEIPDDPHARFDLLRVLAAATLAEHAEQGMHAVIVGPGRSPADIAEVASRPGKVQPRPANDPVGGPEMSYDDWKREAMSLSGPDDWELTLRAVDPPAPPSQADRARLA